ncbi:hypothetical protein PLESTB_000758800 [Pleodorina starrii]|uniref:Uncharacterized protein n=1 Tax=Pleodorina starrii TaxID=330485 RepID=A0A9W6BJV6_9CHLO|nr:hypothetical protein PLESTM_001574600 [Pleodorina starrii]GLC53522.1 hypothetical protein PLESTB_000758800 [Pleodorina starrii]GLC65779.1 hypothetical protein PLESTF_000339000 [Pleodorina starrii]
MMMPSKQSRMAIDSVNPCRYTLFAFEDGGSVKLVGSQVPAGPDGSHGAEAYPTSWNKLPDDVALRAASMLPPNEVACSLRVLNKAAKELYSAPEHRTVHLSRPVPTDVFHQRWDSPGAMRNLSHQQRESFLLLVASSGGSVANLRLAIKATDLCSFSSHAIFEAAAASGRLEVCRLVWQELTCQLGTDSRDKAAMLTASSAGNVEVCTWLHEEHGTPFPEGGVRVKEPSRADVVAEGFTMTPLATIVNAARAGNTQLVTLVLDDEQICTTIPVKWWNHVLPAAAAGCDLHGLQLLYWRAVVNRNSDGDGIRMFPHMRSWALAEAINSPTPDWQAKAEWLLSLPGFSSVCWGENTYFIAWQRPDQRHSNLAETLSRLTWLRDKGFFAQRQYDKELFDLLRIAAEQGDLPGLELLLGAGANTIDAIMRAIKNGRSKAVLLLQSHGCKVTAGMVATLLCQMDPDVGAMEELLERLGYEKVLGRDAVVEAAKSCNIPLLAWMHGHGCKFDEQVFLAAVEGGCEETLEWLAERGCDMGSRGSAYVTCAWRGDMLILECLRRLGCPFGSDTFAEACIRAPLAPLQWMVEQGVPLGGSLVDAEANARRGGKAGVVEWVQGLSRGRQFPNVAAPLRDD